MKLTLKQLRSLAKQTIEENKLVDLFRNEIRNTFGPAIVTEGQSVASIARQVNESLDAGVSPRVMPKVSLLVRFSNNDNPEVRKLTARLLPEKFITRLKDDVNEAVRHAVAKRASALVLFEMCRVNPDDDQLQLIRKHRVINEDLDLKAAAKLSSVSQKNIAIELSDEWYENAARKIINDYGEFSYGTPRPIEHHWNPGAVKNFCDHTRVTSGVHIDYEKLQNTVDNMLTSLEKDPIFKGTLVDLLKNLTETVEKEKINVFEIVSEPTQEFETNISSLECVKKFEESYNVIKADIPAAIRKYRLGEAFATSTQVPAKVKISKLTENVEKSLDKYVHAWNEVQSLRGEPLKIDWCVDPTDASNVCFEMELR